MKKSQKIIPRVPEDENIKKVFGRIVSFYVYADEITHHLRRRSRWKKQLGLMKFPRYLFEEIINHIFRQILDMIYTHSGSYIDFGDFVIVIPKKEERDNVLSLQEISALRQARRERKAKDVEIIDEDNPLAFEL